MSLRAGIWVKAELSSGTEEADLRTGVVTQAHRIIRNEPRRDN